MNLKSLVLLTLALTVGTMFTGCGGDDEVNVDVTVIVTNEVTHVTEVHNTVVSPPVTPPVTNPVVVTGEVVVDNKSSYTFEVKINGLDQSVGAGTVSAPWVYTGHFTFSYDTGMGFWSGEVTINSVGNYKVTFTNDVANPGRWKIVP